MLRRLYALLLPGGLRGQMYFVCATAERPPRRYCGRQQRHPRVKVSTEKTANLPCLPIAARFFPIMRCARQCSLRQKRQNAFYVLENVLDACCSPRRIGARYFGSI